MLDLEQKRSC